MVLFMINMQLKLIFDGEEKESPGGPTKSLGKYPNIFSNHNGLLHCLVRFKEG